MTWKGTAADIYFFQTPPPLLGFFLGRWSNFVGSESGHMHSVKLLQYMLFITPDIPALYTVHKFTCTYSHREGGRVNGEEYRSQSWVENTNMNECTQEISYLQSINSLCWTGKNAADHILE